MKGATTFGLWIPIITSIVALASLEIVEAEEAVCGGSYSLGLEDNYTFKSHSEYPQGKYEHNVICSYFFEVGLNRFLFSKCIIFIYLKIN